MTNRAIRVVLTALLAAAAFVATARAQQLNPTVTLLKSPTASVPADCDQSLAPQPAPRVEVAQIPVPEAPPRKVMAAPPTASVRAQLKDVQSTADRGDRDAFRDALARVKATLATYPAGGEKSAATDVIRVYDDLDRVWTYQMETPTGAFFNATSVPGQVMRGYPGFDRAMADQIIIGADGTKFYPTQETREFLLREAAARLKTLGVTVAIKAPRPARVIPRIATAPAKPRPEAKTAERKKTKVEGTTEATTAKPESIVTEQKPAAHHRPARRHRAETKVAEAHAKPATTRANEAKTETAESTGSMKTPKPEETHKKTSKPAVKRAVKAAPKAAVEKPETATVPATPSSAVPTATTSAPSTATTETTSATAPTTQTTASAPATETTASTPAPATDTTSTASTTDTTASAASTDTTGTAAKGQPQSKGVILPIILIVVGIGVLIVLFRASS